MTSSSWSPDQGSQPSPSVTTTSILLSNLHCPSCVRTINDTLKAYGTDVLDISASPVSQTVTIKHNQRLKATILAKALHDVGFNVQSVQEQRGHNRAPTFPIDWNQLSTKAGKGADKSHFSLSEFSCGLVQSAEQDRAHKATHSAHCEHCAGEEDGQSGRVDSQARLTTPINERYSSEEKGCTDQLTAVTSATSEEAEYKVVLSVSGMTCSSCVGRVTEVLEAKPCVRKVNVNLISQSAAVHIIGKQHASELVEEIEDIGYDAAVDTCEPVEGSGQQSPSRSVPSSETAQRTILTRTEGMYCQHCPAKILNALETFGTQLTISKTPTHLDGIVEISYVPRPPDFTVRDILARINAVDPAFQAHIFHPPSLEERAKRLQARHQRRIALRLALTVAVAIPTFIIGVVFMSLLPPYHLLRMYFMGPAWIGRVPRAQWPLLMLATPVYLFAADLFHRRALKELYMLWRPSSKVPLLRRFYRFGSMDLLLSLGTTVAYFGSIAVVAVDASSTKSSHMADDTEGTTYFDAVVFLTMFLLMGRLLEAYGKAQTADAVSSLGKLRPMEAHLLSASSGKTEEAQPQHVSLVPVEELEGGDVVSVPPGSSPPCDGIIVHGSSTFNESSLTGEAKPITKGVGEEVYAGTVNMTNPVHVRITGFAGLSLLDRIVDIVREGQARRAPIERIADLVTGYFVPAITVLALLDWILWLSLGYAGRIPYVRVGAGGWVFWSLEFAIAVLVVACPCGIGLAAPTALFVGTGLAAKHGILVKGGGEAFQEASNLDCVVFDKTGTITQGGNPVVTNHSFMIETEQKALMSAVRRLESESTHPLAKAILDFCKDSGANEEVVTLETQEQAGKGMTGTFDVLSTKFEIFIGNESLAKDHDVIVSQQAAQHFHEWSSQGKTVVFVGMRPTSKTAAADTVGKWTLALLLAVSDPVRPEAQLIIQKLKATGTDVWLLSGDNVKTARAIAELVGIDDGNVIAQVLPQQKAEKIQYLQKSLKRQTKTRRYPWSRSDIPMTDQRATVAMVGDGINDAPALAMADVGIALGSGSDTAISSADFVLISSDLSLVLLLIQLSRAVLRRVKFNFGWAMGYNLVMLPIAAGVLFPVVNNGSHIRLDPVWASLAMALSSVSVVASSLLLRSNLPFVGFRAWRKDPLRRYGSTSVT